MIEHKSIKSGIVYKSFKKDALIVLGVLLLSFLLFNLVTYYEKHFYVVFSSDAYLNWHIFLELSSIVISFAIFSITFYTFEQSRRLGSIILAYTFLAVCVLDMFHTFSFKGMPIFLTESSVSKATTFWILARMTMAIGMLSASTAHSLRCEKCKRNIGLFVILVYLLFLVVVVNYYPQYIPHLFEEGKGLTPLKIYLEYIIIAIQLITSGIYMRLYFNERDNRTYVLIVISLLISVFSEVAFTLYSNVYDTYNLLGHFYKFVSYYLLFKALFVINVQKPYRELHEAEEKLSAYVNNLEKIVENRTAEIRAANKKLLKNLDDARNIQMALITDEFPKVEGMDFASRYMPCEKVGGDFYNVFRLDEDNIGILIGDVAGHGVSAAMVNVFINQNMRFKVDYDDGRHRIFTPRGVLMNLYHVYNSMSFPEEVYVVVFYAIYNISKRELTYSSAGLNTTPLILDVNGDVRPIELDGFPICKFGSHYKPSYETKSVTLQPGDTLIFYSDGLGEIDRKKPGLFSRENIIEFVKGMKGRTAQEICDELVDAYFTLLGDKEMLDDVTVLVVKTK